MVNESDSSPITFLDFFEGRLPFMKWDGIIETTKRELFISCLNSQTYRYRELKISFTNENPKYKEQASVAQWLAC